MSAPRFNVIASPNDWTKSARRASNRVSEMAGGERKSFLLSYWTAFSEYMKQHGSKYFRPKRPHAIQRNLVWGWPIGDGGLAIANAERSEIGVSLYTDKLAFGALSKARAAFDAAVGEGLDWQELPEQKRSQINLYKTGDNPADESRREERDMHGCLRRWRPSIRRLIVFVTPCRHGSVPKRAIPKRQMRN